VVNASSYCPFYLPELCLPWKVGTLNKVQTIKQPDWCFLGSMTHQFCVKQSRFSLFCGCQILKWKSPESPRTPSPQIKYKCQNQVTFLDTKGIIHYKFVPPKQSITYSTFKFQNICGSIFNKKDQMFGWTSEFCNMTMHHPTQHF